MPASPSALLALRDCILQSGERFQSKKNIQHCPLEKKEIKKEVALVANNVL